MKSFTFSKVLSTVFIFLTLLIVGGRASFAEDTSPQANTKLRNLEMGLQEIEKSQTAMLASQDEIVTEIKNLKIWVNKHRHGSS